MNFKDISKVLYITKHEMKNKSKRVVSKHQASKKGYKHSVNPSKGESNTKLKIGAFRVKGLYLQKLPNHK